MNLRQAAQQALEFLSHDMVAEDWQHQKRKDAVCDALRAALAEPQTTHWEGCEAVHPECKERVMDRELIIRLAREAGAVFPADGSWHKFEVEGSLERFAALVAAHERKHILEMCKEGWWDGEGIRYHLEQQDAIRSRT